MIHLLLTIIHLFWETGRRTNARTGGETRGFINEVRRSLESFAPVALNVMRVNYEDENREYSLSQAEWGIKAQLF